MCVGGGCGWVVRSVCVWVVSVGGCIYVLWKIVCLNPCYQYKLVSIQSNVDVPCMLQACKEKPLLVH